MLFMGGAAKGASLQHGVVSDTEVKAVQVVRASNTLTAPLKH